MALFHEEYVPEDAIDMVAVKRNLGRTSGDSFVYSWMLLAKHPKGDMFILALEKGTYLYKGFGKKLICSQVKDPAECAPSDSSCDWPKWYSDYTTAMRYAGGNPKQLYVFETVQETGVKLINILDKRNVQILLSVLEDRMAEIDAEEGLTEEVRRTKKAKPIGYIKQIIGFTGFETLEHNKTLHPEYDPANFVELERRFGPQTELNRTKSVYGEAYFAVAVEETLKLAGLGGAIHGYFAPTYQSEGQNLSASVKNAFHREICLFKPRGLVRHAKTNPRDGCMQPGGGRRRRSLRNKIVNRKSRRTHRKNR